MAGGSSTVVACLAIFSVVLLRSTGADIFSSIVHFEQVLRTEETLASNIKAFIEKEEDRLQQLKQITEEYKRHSRENLPDVESYLANPLNAYLLIKKFTTDWYKVISLIRNEEAAVFANNVTKTLPFFPNKDDLVGAVKGMLRIQDTYALDTAQLARGDVKGLSQTRELTSDDCMVLGHTAYFETDPYHAIMWFQEAVSRMRQEGADNTTLVEALLYLEYSLYVQGNVEAALNMTGEILEMDPRNDQALRNRDGYKKMLQNRKPRDVPVEIRNKRIKRGYHTTAEFDKYERLCRGEMIQENPFRDTVTCQYKRDHPYYILRPLKEEVIMEDPFIAVYHDLITDIEIAAVKALAKPKLHRSVLLAREDGKHTDDYRVSKSAWLLDSDHWLIEHVSQKVSAATGLSLEASEDLQVLNYGMGGQYEPHLDWATDMKKTRQQGHFRRYGNRISTSLYYMTDVPGGGGTVFPHLGVHVAPEKGMMLLWYNLHKNGTGDKRTVHAGCPVLVGSKWVCNKWIHERSQEFRRPCGLNPFE